MSKGDMKLNPQRVSYHVNDGGTTRRGRLGRKRCGPGPAVTWWRANPPCLGGTARALAEQGWYAVALDLRGHGDSGWSPDGNYQIDVFVADLHRVLPHFTQRPVLVGASLGGMTALLTAGEAPQPMSTAVVLVDITRGWNRKASIAFAPS